MEPRARLSYPLVGSSGCLGSHPVSVGARWISARRPPCAGLMRCSLSPATLPQDDEIAARPRSRQRSPRSITCTQGRSQRIGRRFESARFHRVNARQGGVRDHRRNHGSARPASVPRQMALGSPFPARTMGSTNYQERITIEPGKRGGSPVSGGSASRSTTFSTISPRALDLP